MLDQHVLPVDPAVATTGGCRDRVAIGSHVIVIGSWAMTLRSREVGLDTVRSELDRVVRVQALSMTSRVGGLRSHRGHSQPGQVSWTVLPDSSGNVLRSSRTRCCRHSVAAKARPGSLTGKWGA